MIRREKRAMAASVEKLERENQDSKVIVSSYRAEIGALRDQIDHIKGGHEKVSETNEDLKEKMLIERARGSQEVRDIQQRLNALTVQHEHEKGQLTQHIHMLDTKLDTSQEMLKALKSSGEEGSEKCRALEHKLDQVKLKLGDETVSRKMVEEKLEMMKNQTKESLREKVGLDGRIMELQGALCKCEQKLEVESARCAKLHNASVEHELNVRTVNTSYQEQVTLLQKELKQQNSTHNSKYHSGMVEYKKRLDESEAGRKRLEVRMGHLTSDLDLVKADNTEKNKENLHLQQEMLLVGDKLRDMSSKLKLVQDSLIIEQDMQVKLQTRNVEAESEVKELKGALRRFGGGDTKWDGLSEKVGELANQMRTHFTNRHDPDPDTVRWYTQKLKDSEIELDTERTMHEVTRRSLREAEDDLRSLRQNLRAQRRRSPGPDDRSDKSRSERINEIITRSQLQAQALIASGAHLSDVVNASFTGCMSTHDTSHSALTPLNCSFTSTSTGTGTDALPVIVSHYRDSLDSL